MNQLLNILCGGIAGLVIGTILYMCGVRNEFVLFGAAVIAGAVSNVVLNRKPKTL